MDTLLITSATAAILGMLQISLMVPIGLARNKLTVPYGDQGNIVLLKKIRRHGNLTENAPIFLILLALLESATTMHTYTVTIACIFIAARLSHVIALTKEKIPAFFRAFGAFGTMIGISGTSLALMWHLL